LIEPVFASATTGQTVAGSFLGRGLRFCVAVMSATGVCRVQGEVTLLDAEGMRRALARIAYEVIERAGADLSKVVLIGVRTRGWHLARRLAERVAEIEGVRLPHLALDVSAFRDDVPATLAVARPQGDAELAAAVDKRSVILVDDVLFTGRTVRAALDALTCGARPARIQLAVLVDRGHRELPIRPDYVGKNMPTAKAERVRVLLSEVDGDDGVRLQKG